MCLRLVASLAALAVAQQEPESYVRPSSMNLDAYKKAKDEAAMLRLLLGNPNAGDAAYYSKLVDIAAELGHCHVLDNALARGGHPHGESGSGPAPQGTDSWMEVASSDDAEKWKGALGEDQAHKVKVDEHATQHPIGVVDHVVDKRPLPLTFACIVQSPAAVECVRSLLEAGADPDAGGGMLAPLNMIVNGGPGASRSASQRAVELAITKMLLAAGADPNASEPFQGCSAAFYAAQKGLDDILEVLVENGADLEMANKGGTNPMMLAAAIFDVPVEAAGGTEATARLLVRLGAKLEPPKAIELELSNGIPTLPENNFLRYGKTELANLVRYVIRNGGDAASPNSRVTPEALALRERLVDEFETAAARFAVGDAVTLQNVSLTYNGLVGTIAGPINSKLSFPVKFAREGLPPKINIKSSNLAAAEDTYSDEL